MPNILLINPNTSTSTTEMMVAIATSALGSGRPVTGYTAQTGVGMIVQAEELLAAAQEVQHTWRRAGADWAGIIVSAFGDPGMEQLRASTSVPVVGICEASLLEAAQGGRRFGIATVTPALAQLIQQRVDALGLAAQYTGIRLTPGDPRVLATHPAQLEAELAMAVNACIGQDGAQAVVIGGGPLAQAAAQLQARTGVPIIEPIPAAVRQLLGRLQARPIAKSLANR
ncbi:Asp/Glu/hydantoin racemase [Rhodoferax ferrireducens]|uniref:Asp/Glu/hydantoin racemase n=1 Tax=Rhodoferax ferrireducens TaxID=192843 RepID=A0ABU2C3U2_9BURK|nr:aspartate/glutamate racemase family protein [Rhodoferax ferrireducens]MDR7375990.1 Asp/Glu/hydantoin racemase [Rhodoferax ferrireducens]